MLTINLHPFPVIETERLILRQILPADVNEVFFLRSDSEVMRYIDRQPCASVEEALAHINKLYKMWEENEGVAWALCIKGDQTMIGTIGIWNIAKEHYRAEIGYVLHPAFQGKGLMNEAMKEVLTYGFHKLNLHSLEANVNAENTSSIKLLERNLFLREGYHRENYFFNGKFLDSAVYSLLSPLPFKP